MSAHDNSLLLDTDSSNSTAPTTTAVLSSFTNASLFQSTPRGGHRTFNIALLAGSLSAGLLLVLVVIYALVKYRNRDEGSYKIDESKNFIASTHVDAHNGAGKSSASSQHRQKLLSGSEPNGADCREWYV